jgi:hypothetical protein
VSNSRILTTPVRRGREARVTSQLAKRRDKNAREYSRAGHQDSPIFSTISLSGQRKKIARRSRENQRRDVQRQSRTEARSHLGVPFLVFMGGAWAHGQRLSRALLHSFSWLGRAAGRRAVPMRVCFVSRVTGHGGEQRERSAFPGAVSVHCVLAYALLLLTWWWLCLPRSVDLGAFTWRGRPERRRPAAVLAALWRALDAHTVPWSMRRCFASRKVRTQYCWLTSLVTLAARQVASHVSREIKVSSDVTLVTKTRVRYSYPYLLR